MTTPTTTSGTAPKASWLQKGYVDEPVPAGIDLPAAIRQLCQEKNAIILAHYYTEGAVQDVADFVGDSLALAQQAARTEADVILMCGVHFMGETCKLLSPQKTVLLPDAGATCSLAESCPAEAFAAFVRSHPGHKVVSYVNTSAAIKALTDVVVTSGNARQVVESFAPDEPLIFGPDRNLGRYINEQTGRQMLLWDGACHVHQRFTAAAIQALKRQHPAAPVLVHPECPAEVVALADCVGSTAALLRYAVESPAEEFIVVTEAGILHEMQRRAPGKTFLPVPAEGQAGGCNRCEHMCLATLPKMYNALRYGWPTVEVAPDVAEAAVRPIRRMLDISARLGL